MKDLCISSCMIYNEILIYIEIDVQEPCRIIRNAEAVELVTIFYICHAII